MDINPYHHKPHPIFLGKGPLYLGTEIELEMREGTGYSREGILERAEVDEGIWYAKKDGSLNYGVELVSHPATIEVWRRMDLEPFERLRKQFKCRSYQTYTCGMHVHVSRKALTPFRIFKLLSLLADNPELVYRLSGRKTRGLLEEWSNVEVSETVYCNTWNETLYRYTRDGVLFANSLSAKASGKLDSARGVALNLQPTYTVEFRLFQGTLTASRIRKNLELVHAMVRFTESHSVQAMTWTTFHRWLASSEGRKTLTKQAASTLYTFIKERL